MGGEWLIAKMATRRQAERRQWQRFVMGGIEPPTDRDETSQLKAWYRKIKNGN